MIKVEIPDEAFWAAIGFCIVVSVTSGIRFLRWQKDVMTKKDHTAICVVNQTQIKDNQTRVIEILEQQDRASSEYRDQSNKKMDVIVGDVAALKTDVAVLKATQPQIHITAQGGASG